MYKYSAGYIDLLRKLIRIDPSAAKSLIQRDLSVLKLGSKETANRVKNINLKKPISDAARLGTEAGRVAYGTAKRTGQALHRGYTTSGEALNKMYDNASRVIPENRKKQIAGASTLGGGALLGLGGYGVYEAHKSRQPGANVNYQQRQRGNSLNSLLQAEYGN